jgi:O-antigen/teichoic acid export membrane protein
MVNPNQLITRLRRLFLDDSLFRNATYLMASTAIMSALGFGFWIFVAHLYTASAIGVASALISITLLISNLSMLGLNAGLIRFLPGSKDQSRDINAAIITVGATAMVAAFVYLLISYTIGAHFDIFIANFWSWPIFMVVMAAVALNTLTDAVFIANRKAEYHTIVYTSFGVTKLFLPLVLIPFASLGIFIAYIASVVVSLVLSLYFMRHGTGYVISSKPNWSILSATRKYAASNYAGVLLAGLPSQILPTVIIASLGTAESAYFALSWTMANLLYVIPSSITQSLLAESSHDIKKRTENLKRAVKILAVILVPVILVAILVAPVLLRIFGQQYATGSTQIFQIMAFSTIFIAVSSVSATILNIRQKSFGIVIAQAVLVVVTLISTTFLLHDGLVGVGLAMLLGYVAANLTYGIIFLREHLKTTRAQSELKNAEANPFMEKYGVAAVTTMRKLISRKQLGSYLKYGISIFATLALLFILSNPMAGYRYVVQSVNAPTPVPTTSVYGFSTSLDSLSPNDLDTHLTDIAATGATWVRFDISWDKVQHNNPRSYDWSAYDRVQQALTSHHLHALGIIEFTPGWARSSSCSNSKMCPARDPAVFGNFAGIVAQRYASDDMRDWEIWNEPNISYRYHPQTDPSGYAAILKASYTAIKRADPAALVIAGGTAPSATDSMNLRPDDFITALYANGAKGSFDAIAAHPYTYPDSPEDNLPLGAWAQLEAMHQTMVANGDGQKKVWITEFGAPTNGPNKVGEYISEAQQAHILTEALLISKSYTWAGPFFWYDYRDGGTSTNSSENFYGLVRYDGSHKPSYDAWVAGIATK